MSQVSTANATGTATPFEAWRCLLYEHMRARPTPVLVAADGVSPGASLWSASRLWANHLRALGLAPGDRVALALPASRAFVAAMVGASFSGITVAPCDPRRLHAEGAQPVLDELDARVIIGEAHHHGHHEACIRVGYAGGPDEAQTVNPREPRFEPTPEAAFLMRTSGTGGRPTWVALSHANVLANLHSHLPRFGLDGAVVLSVVPWHHAFGLFIDLLPTIAAGATIVREPSHGRDAQTIINACEDFGVTHMCMVPLQAEMLAATQRGRGVLRGLDGGVIGGAPIDANLAAQLAGTRLRVGYGQTEASPGITLGDQGEFAAGYIGTPVGCETRIGDDGVLYARGPNVCLGSWDAEGLTQRPRGGWLRTGDVVRPARGAINGMTFLGRVNDEFKLANGRLVQTAAIEEQLREALGHGYEPVLVTIDRRRVECCVLCRRPGGLPAETRQRLSNALQPLGRVLGGVHTLADEGMRTPKGSVVRHRVIEALRRDTRPRLAA